MLIFPPRDVVLRFREQLEQKYAGPTTADGLGREATITRWVNQEGIAVWLTEYLRYFAAGASDAEAEAAVLEQIQGRPAPALPTTGTDAFPPRDWSLEFLEWLDHYYRDQLHAPSWLTAVDADGESTWTQQFLLYMTRGFSEAAAGARVFVDIDRIVAGLPPLPEPAPLPPPAPPPTVTVSTETGPLTLEGPRLRRADGAQWFGLGAITWQLFGSYWMQGNRAFAEAVLDFLVAHQLAFCDIATMYNGGLGQFDPRTPGTYEALEGFLEAVGARQLRAFVEALADVQNFDKFDSHAHVDQVGAVCAHAPDLRIFREGNESDQNGFSQKDYARPAGAMLCTKGSGGGNGPDEPASPPWDLADYEPPRDEFERRGKAMLDLRTGNTSSGASFPGVRGVKEPIGIDEVAEPGRTTNEPAKVFDDVATVRLFGGSYYGLYPRAFNRAELPGPIATACIDAAREACGAMPLDFALGQYTRDRGTHFTFKMDGQGNAIPGDPASCLRFYQMQMGARGVAIAITPGKDFVATPTTCRVLEARGLAGRAANIWIFEA